MKCASTSSLVSVSSKGCVKENTSQKNVRITQPAREKVLAKSDILKTVSDILPEIVVSKWIVPTKHQSNIAVLDQSNIEQKVKFLENFVHELSLKLLNMEEELQALKQTKVGENSKVETKYFTEELEKAETYIDEELEYSKEEETEVFPEIDLSHISGKK